MNNQRQRSGKWTDAEQIYANALIEGFRLGQLDIQEGTSLRKLLATKLLCNVKRVSKKFEGTDYQGKNLYVRDKNLPPEVIEAKKEQLDRLERAFYSSIDGGGAGEDGGPASFMSAGAGVDGASSANFLPAGQSTGGAGLFSSNFGAGVGSLASQRLLTDPSLAGLSNTNHALLGLHGGGGGNNLWNNSLATSDSSSIASLIRQGGLAGGPSSHFLSAASGLMGSHHQLLGGIPGWGGATGSVGGNLAHLSASLGGFGGAQSADALRLRLLEESLRYPGSAGAGATGRMPLAVDQQNPLLAATLSSASSRSSNNPLLGGVGGDEGSLHRNDLLLRNLLNVGQQTSPSLRGMVSAPQSGTSTSLSSTLSASSDAGNRTSSKRQFDELCGSGREAQGKDGKVSKTTNP